MTSMCCRRVRRFLCQGEGAIVQRKSSVLRNSCRILDMRMWRRDSSSNCVMTLSLSRQFILLGLSTRQCNTLIMFSSTWSGRTSTWLRQHSPRCTRYGCCSSLNQVPHVMSVSSLPGIFASAIAGVVCVILHSGWCSIGSHVAFIIQCDSAFEC